MSNDLVVSGMSYDELAKITGQGASGNGGPVFPRLGVNREAEDDDGNPLPVGTFFFRDADGNKHFSKTAKFRPFINTYQYQIYDAVERKTVNRTILFKNFRDEIIDIKGGIACGKVMGKEKDNLTEAQKEAQKKIKCYRLVFGTVTFPDGPENVPVIWRMSGANFMAPDIVFKELSKGKKLLWSVDLDLSLTRKKAGATTYYEVNADYDRTQAIPFTAEDMDLLKRFNEVIQGENEVVRTAYTAALRGVPTQNDLDDERDLADILGDDLDD